jgi:hypothetical protein
MENAHSITATAGDTEVIIFMDVILLMKCMQVILFFFLSVLHRIKVICSYQYLRTDF